MARTVLVTGVSRHLGARVARGLAVHHDVNRVIGLDVITPSEELGRADFVRADVRNPVVGRLLNQARVDTVVHLALSTYHASGRARSSQKEANVIGTMQLFAACQQAESLQRIVLKSTGAVYGSSPRDPALFTEDQTAPRSRAQGPVRDALEVEGYLRATRRRRPELEYSALRLAHVVGPHMSSPLLDYLSLPVVPIPFGYDARLQLLHEDDAVAAIIRAVVGPAAGVVNVAAPGVLKLSQAVALAGRPFVLVPTNTGLSLDRLTRLGRLGRLGKADLDFVRFGRVLDTTRAAEVLGFRPRYTTRAAFLDAASAFAPPVPAVTSVRGWAGALAAALLPSGQPGGTSADGTGADTTGGALGASAGETGRASSLDLSDLVLPDDPTTGAPYDVLSLDEPAHDEPPSLSGEAVGKRGAAEETAAPGPAESAAPVPPPAGGREESLPHHHRHRGARHLPPGRGAAGAAHEEVNGGVR